MLLIILFSFAGVVSAALSCLFTVSCWVLLSCPSLFSGDCFCKFDWLISCFDCLSSVVWLSTGCSFDWSLSVCSEVDWSVVRSSLDWLSLFDGWFAVFVCAWFCVSSLCIADEVSFLVSTVWLSFDHSFVAHLNFHYLPHVIVLYDFQNSLCTSCSAACSAAPNK